MNPHPHRMSPPNLSPNTSPSAPVCRCRKAWLLLGRTLRSTRWVRHECAAEERLPDAGDRERGYGRGKRCSWGFGGQRKRGQVARCSTWEPPERPGDCRRLPSGSTLYTLSCSGSPMAGLVARMEPSSPQHLRVWTYGIRDGFSKRLLT